MEMKTLLETGAAAALFALTFLVGGHVHPLRFLVRDRRVVISFAAGMTAAYVFVRLLPELHGARESYTETTSLPLYYEGMLVYFLALVGFLLFYALENLRSKLGRPANGEAGEIRAFRIHVGGFVAYVALMSYLLVHGLEGEGVQTLLYAVAVALHFLGIDHALRADHGARYERIGRFVLAGACILGWMLALAVALPEPVVALMVAFISGGIIMNSLIEELPSEKDGRFLPFVAGGLIYGLILVPLG